MKTTAETIKEINKTGLYEIVVDGNEIHIHKPSYINITIDSRFEIEETSGRCVWRFWNSKVLVTLWKNVQNMHITVLG